jgi:hypothetical protein
MWEIRNPYSILVGIPEGKRALERDLSIDEKVIKSFVEK